MNKVLLTSILSVLMLLPGWAQNNKDMAKIYDFKTTGNKGAEVDLSLIHI